MSFNVYGYSFSVRGNSTAALDGIAQDFAFFATAETEAAAAGAVQLELIEDDPPRQGLPSTDAVVYTPRNVVYQQGGLRYIDYHGRALGIREPSGNLKLYSRDANLLYEAAYLYLLSQIGQKLDARGLHRMHALGVAIGGRAILVLLPMGGGKSTLGLHLLKHSQVQILSDDSPFINRQGRALAYPLRLGLLPGSEDAIPAEYRRVVQRMEFGAKHLVNYSYFQDRVCRSAEPFLVLVGARTMNPECRIEPLGRLAGLRACVANCIVGVGLFQGVEFILQASAWELIKHAGIGISRLRNCVRLLRRSRVCRVHLGADAELNARTVVEYAVSLSAK